MGISGFWQEAGCQIRRPDLRRGSAKGRQAPRHQRSAGQNRKGLHVEAAQPGMAKRLLDIRSSAVSRVGRYQEQAVVRGHLTSVFPFTLYDDQYLELGYLYNNKQE